MKMSSNIKPISYLKAHASEIIKHLTVNQNSIIITQNGEAKAVLYDIKAYEELQESLALLKIMAQSSQHLSKGKVKSLKKSFSAIRRKIKKKHSQRRNIMFMSYYML